MLTAVLSNGEPGIATDWTTDALLKHGAYALIAMVLILALPWIMRYVGGGPDHVITGVITLLGTVGGGVYLLMLAENLMRHTPSEDLGRTVLVFLGFAVAEWINLSAWLRRGTPWWLAVILPAVFTYGIVMTWSEVATGRHAAALGINPMLLNLPWIVLAAVIAAAVVLKAARR